MISLAQNIPFVYQLMHHDVKSSQILSKLPKELANLNELSPILDKKQTTGINVDDQEPFTFL